MRNVIVFLVGLSTCFSVLARDELKIVGSSTVYPFSSFVAEEFGSVSRYHTPVVESTGTGGGMKLFCSGNEMDTPDIVNASRRIKVKELNLCLRNGVSDITEVIFGYDGIVIAQFNGNKPMAVTKKELLLAVAKLVPNASGNKLIDNPYTHWNQINPELPKRKITIYGPPISSGTRDAFEEIVLEYQTQDMKVYRDSGNKGYRIIRTDGVYIPSGENDNLIVKKLSKDKEAVGIFGYSFLVENTDSISAFSVDGIEPTMENISNKDYPISRSLFFYSKNSHIEKVPGMMEFMELFLDEEIVGPDGLLTDMGLIPLTDHALVQSKQNLANRTKVVSGQLEIAKK